MLTERRKRFADAFVATGNATESARRAGYSDNQRSLEVQGSRLLRNDEVQQAIEERARTTADAKDLSPEYVIEGFMLIAQDAFADRQYAAANQALRELGRVLALFTDRVSVEDVRTRARQAAIDAGLDPDQVESEAIKLLEPPK